MFNERQPNARVTSPQAWHEYAEVLYDISEQPPSLTHMAHASMSSSLLLKKKWEFPLLAYNLEKVEIMMNW